MTRVARRPATSGGTVETSVSVSNFFCAAWTADAIVDSPSASAFGGLAPAKRASPPMLLSTPSKIDFSSRAISPAIAHSTS